MVDPLKLLGEEVIYDRQEHLQEPRVSNYPSQSLIFRKNEKKNISNSSQIHLPIFWHVRKDPLARKDVWAPVTCLFVFSCSKSGRAWEKIKLKNIHNVNLKHTRSFSLIRIVFVSSFQEVTKIPGQHM